jgi:hypothetical protein
MKNSLLNFGNNDFWYDKHINLTKPNLTYRNLTGTSLFPDKKFPVVVSRLAIFTLIYLDDSIQIHSLAIGIAECLGGVNAEPIL